MNKIKFLLCIYLLLNKAAVYSQNRVFLFAPNCSDTVSEKEINRIRIPWGNHGRSILAFYNDGTKSSFDKKTIWGFKKRDNHVLRFYKGNTFQIVDTGLVIIYKTYSPHPVYYFSENLESKIILLGKKKMIKELGIDKFIQVYKKNPLVKELA